MVNMSGKIIQLTIFPLHSLSCSQAATICFNKLTSLVPSRAPGFPKIKPRLVLPFPPGTIESPRPGRFFLRRSYFFFRAS
jgi:hypothetical protein